MQVLGPNHWAAHGDERFAPDNVMISSRDANIVAIIDKGTGAIVWHLGPAYPPRGSDYKPETTPRPVDQIVGQHDPHIIAAGLPGAGDILLLDNQARPDIRPPSCNSPAARACSRSIRSARGSSGSIRRTIAPARRTGRSGTPIIGSVQRLPNGNTLIDEGIDGRLFQVTPAGEIVWEYVSPYVGTAPLVPQLLRGKAKSNWIYRSQAVPYAWVPPVPHGEHAVTAPALSQLHVAP